MPATVFADQIFPGAKIITASLSVSNTSGSYSTTVSDDRMTGSMKAIALEIADPSVFNGKISVNATAGQYTFSCPDTAGSTTVVISFLKTADDPTQLTSSEFDVLNNRIATINIASVTAHTDTVTTGSTGNINTGVVCDGHKFVFGAFCTNDNVFLRVWVSANNHNWYLTAIDPNSGATKNNTSLGIKYLVMEINS